MDHSNDDAVTDNTSAHPTTITNLEDLDALLTGATTQLMHAVQHQIGPLVSGELEGNDFMDSFVGQLSPEVQQQTEVIDEVESFGRWVVEQLMPTRSKVESLRLTGKKLLGDIEQDVCVSKGHIFHVTVFYDGHTRVPFVESSQGVRVYTIRRNERVTISMQNLGVQPFTILAVCGEDPEHGDGAPAATKLDPRSVQPEPTAVGASKLDETETEDRWRLTFGDGKPLLEVRLVAEAPQEARTSPQADKTETSPAEKKRRRSAS